MSVRHRTHHTSHCQTIEVVIHKDHYTKGNHRNLSTDSCLDMLRGPFAESSRAAGFIEQCDQNAKHHKEYKNTHIPGIRQLHDHAAFSLIKNRVQHQLQVKIGI